MEALVSLISICPPGSIPIVICILGLAFIYFKIKSERKETKTERDDEISQIKMSIALLNNEIERIKSLDLEAKLAQILTDLNWLKQKFMEK